MYNLSIIAARSEVTDQFINQLSTAGYDHAQTYYDYDDFIYRYNVARPDLILMLLDKTDAFLNKTIKYISTDAFGIPYVFCINNMKNKIVQNISKFRPHNLIYAPFIPEQLVNIINITLNNQPKMTPLTKETSIHEVGRTTTKHAPIDLAANQLKYAFFKSGIEIIKIYFTEICYVQSDHVYVFLNTVNKKIPLRAKLEDIENYLPASHFQRIHQRYIVNIDHITRVNADFVFLDKTELPVSKKYKKALLSQMNVFT